MAFCKRCQCSHVLIYEERGGAPLRCPKCSRFLAFINEEVYKEPEPIPEPGPEPTPEPESVPEPVKKSFLITLESPDGELVIPVREKMDVGRNSAGKEYLGQFPDVTRAHFTIAPRANGISATLTDHGRWGTYINGTRMIKESSVVVSNYSEIRLASRAILLVRVKEVEEND